MDKPAAAAEAFTAARSSGLSRTVIIGILRSLRIEDVVNFFAMNRHVVLGLNAKTYFMTVGYRDLGDLDAANAQNDLFTLIPG
jgi:hypothetical protein